MLFGGAGNTPQNAEAPFFGDTWEWDGSFWTQMQDIGPAARALGAMAYNSARGVSVLFGGQVSNAQAIGDTWQWDGANWTKVSESGPAARYGHAVAFDGSRNRLVLFGGQAGQTVFSDTWEFDGENWTQQEDTGPSPRFGHAMAYDGAGRVVLFGGSAATQPPSGDTWAWSGQEWVQIGEFGPSARLHSAMASPDDGTLVLYGGKVSIDISTAPSADTWAFDGKRWTQRQDIGPGPLQQAAIAFDSARNTVILFGGLGVDGAPNSGSTWEAAVSAQAAPPVPSPPGPPSSVSVTNFFFPEQQSPNVLALDTIQHLVVRLSGPAPQNGVVVNISGPIFDGGENPMTSINVPAGSDSYTALIMFKSSVSPANTKASISANTTGTPPVTVQISFA